jgi:hypothetical protein
MARQNRMQHGRSVALAVCRVCEEDGVIAGLHVPRRDSCGRSRLARRDARRENGGL